MRADHRQAVLEVVPTWLMVFSLLAAMFSFFGMAMAGVALSRTDDLGGGGGGAGLEEESVNPNSGLRGGLDNFDFEAAQWNAYWYSRYNLGSLVMMSGLGVGMAPPPEAR